MTRRSDADYQRAYRDRQRGNIKLVVVLPVT